MVVVAVDDQKRSEDLEPAAGTLGIYGSGIYGGLGGAGLAFPGFTGLPVYGLGFPGGFRGNIYNHFD